MLSVFLVFFNAWLNRNQLVLDYYA